MGNTKIISIGSGGQNILESIRKDFPSDIATSSLCADSGKITEQAINQIIPSDITKLVMISCLGGHSSTIAPEIVKTAKKKNIECLCVCIMPFSTEGEEICLPAEKALNQIKTNADILIVLKNDWILERYGDLFINQAIRKMDELVWKLIKEYIIENEIIAL